MLIAIPTETDERVRDLVRCRETFHLITGDLKHFGCYFGTRIHGILVLPPADYIRTIDHTF